MESKEILPSKKGKYFGTDPEVLAEMKALANENGGLLKPEKLLEAARNEDSPLHSKFTWDDSIAAERYRMIQARFMISVSVQYIPRGNKVIPTKVFVSLSTDRYVGKHETNGYRMLTDVLQNNDMKNQMLADSLDQMTSFQTRYKNLQELKDVFTVMDKTKTHIEKKLGKEETK